MFRQTDNVAIAPAVTSEYNKIGTSKPFNNPVNGFVFIARNDQDKYGLVAATAELPIREKIKSAVVGDEGDGVYSFQTTSAFDGTESLRIAGRIFTFAVNINELQSGEFYCDRDTVYFKV
jgi:hypothetical protein